MTQMHGRPVEDRARRREYLLKKAIVHATAAVGATMSSICVVALGSLLVLLLDLTSCYLLFHWLPWWWVGGFYAVALLTVVTCLTGIISAWLFRASAKRGKALAHVPSIREQRIATLPADEVLLRGSDAPNGSTNALLRAVQVSGTALETSPPASDGLLRAASGSERVADELLRPMEAVPVDTSR